MSRVIVVEDQISLLNSLRRGLEEEGFEVLTASSGREAHKIIRREPADVVLLDWMLPDGDGLSLLRRLREEDCRQPILLITAKDSISDRVLGLDSGADDYLIKPFDFNELLARIRALLRRMGTNSFETSLRYDNLVLDSIARQATRGGRDLQLTQRQFELLEYLLRHKNSVVSRDALARDVWKASTATWTNVIEVQINQLRKRIAGPGWQPILHTIRGEGYILGDEK